MSRFDNDPRSIRMQGRQGGKNTKMIHLLQAENAELRAKLTEAEQDVKGYRDYAEELSGALANLREKALDLSNEQTLIDCVSDPTMVALHARDQLLALRAEIGRLRDFAIGQIRAYIDDIEPERDGLARGAYNNQRHTARAAYCALIGDSLAKPTREDLESVVWRTKFTVRESEAQDA